MTTLLAPNVVRRIPWRLYEGAPGVRAKILWHDRSGGSYAGMLSMRPGASLPAHTHGRAAHHAWVAEGTCTIAGHDLKAGSYSHVGPGTLHGIEAGPMGCVIFYLYLHPDDDTGGGPR